MALKTEGKITGKLVFFLQRNGWSKKQKILVFELKLKVSVAASVFLECRDTAAAACMHKECQGHKQYCSRKGSVSQERANNWTGVKINL